MTPAAEGSPPPLRLASAMSIGSSAAGDVVREIAVLKKLDHPNVVRLQEVCLCQVPHQQCCTTKLLVLC